MARRDWTRDELIVAFNLYCKTPFGRYHRLNPDIVELAAKLGRTPDALAMKLGNFASLDPTHQRRGIKGLANGSKADKVVWDEFNKNWTDLATESERAYRELLGQTLVPRLAPGGSEELEDEVGQALPTPDETETQRVVRVRLGQAFFRETVLASYDKQCCICGLPCPRLLIASHIIPWAERADLRMNPRNGLALCALHDRAFDSLFISVDPSTAVILSPVLEQHLPHQVIEDMFVRFRGVQLRPPKKFKPLPEFFESHCNRFKQQVESTARTAN